MMKYLVILLSDQSVSFCNYNLIDKFEENKLIPLDILMSAIKYAFMEDLFIQFVLPSFPLPKEYEDIIKKTKSSIIAPISTEYNADVLVANGFSEFKDFKIRKDISYALRVNKLDFFKHYNEIKRKLIEISRLNIIFIDVETFTEKDFKLYQEILNEFVFYLKDIILSGKIMQLNILTDRLFKEDMNNCNAGVNAITIAPNGNFYICPAFYYRKEESVGDLNNGLIIKNSQLYKLEYAPLCRDCDAYQCKRCIFLNKQLTREVNIPSREQCVMAHIERNASRLLLLALREHINYMPEKEIKEILYLDPFDNIKK